MRRSIMPIPVFMMLMDFAVNPAAAIEPRSRSNVPAQESRKTTERTRKPGLKTEVAKATPEALEPKGSTRTEKLRKRNELIVKAYELYGSIASALGIETDHRRESRANHGPRRYNERSIDAFHRNAYAMNNIAAARRNKRKVSVLNHQLEIALREIRNLNMDLGFPIDDCEPHMEAPEAEGSSVNVIRQVSR